MGFPFDRRYGGGGAYCQRSAPEEIPAQERWLLRLFNSGIEFLRPFHHISSAQGAKAGDCNEVAMRSAVQFLHFGARPVEGAIGRETRERSLACSVEVG